MKIYLEILKYKNYILKPGSLFILIICREKVLGRMCDKKNIRYDTWKTPNPQLYPHIYDTTGYLVSTTHIDIYR